MHLLAVDTTAGRSEMGQSPPSDLHTPAVVSISKSRERKTIPRVCLQCSKGFLAKKSRAKKGGGKYCSAICQRARQALRKKVRIKKPAVLSNPPHPRLSCALCLWNLGLGYNRISKATLLKRGNITAFIRTRKRKGLSRSFVAAYTAPTRPTRLSLKLPVAKNPLLKLAKRLESKRKKRRRAALRSMVWKWLFHGKSTKTVGNIVGCDVAFFKGYISSLFRKGMSWENYGKVWQLDHICPLKAFDLSCEIGIRTAFHYSNYQPLFRSENMRKQGKILPHQPQFLFDHTVQHGATLLAATVRPLPSLKQASRELPKNNLLRSLNHSYATDRPESLETRA